MKYKLFYTSKAKKDLSFLNKKTASSILNKIDFFIQSGNPFKYAKKLVDKKQATYRFRIGDYRAIFDVDKNGNIILLLILF